MQQNALLNDVLIVMARSLLQYAARAWPWTGGGADGALLKLNDLVDGQIERIQRLVALLEERRVAIDFGAFPDFTDLHYLSLEFVLPHLVGSQQAVVREIELALLRCVGDERGTALLSEILEGERETLATLEESVRPRPSQPVA